jgi:hypothetical protein
VKRLSSIIQFIIGFFLGIAILAGGTTAFAYVFFTKMTNNPPKPTFSEEKAPKTATSQENQASASSESQQAAATQEQENLPPGAYKARVSWADGLSLRSEASREAERIGGIAYNAEIVVLEESEDKQWQKVRLSEGTQEGWIKSGNIEKVE